MANIQQASLPFMKCSLQRRVYFDGCHSFFSPGTEARLIALIHKRLLSEFSFSLGILYRHNPGFSPRRLAQPMAQQLSGIFKI